MKNRRTKTQKSPNEIPKIAERKPKKFGVFWCKFGQKIAEVGKVGTRFSTKLSYSTIFYCFCEVEIFFSEMSFIMHKKKKIRSKTRMFSIVNRYLSKELLSITSILRIGRLKVFRVVRMYCPCVSERLQKQRLSSKLWNTLRMIFVWIWFKAQENSYCFVVLSSTPRESFSLLFLLFESRFVNCFGTYFEKSKYFIINFYFFCTHELKCETFQKLLQVLTIGNSAALWTTSPFAFESSELNTDHWQKDRRVVLCQMFLILTVIKLQSWDQFVLK